MPVACFAVAVDPKPRRGGGDGRERERNGMVSVRKRDETDLLCQTGFRLSDSSQRDESLELDFGIRK